MEVWTGEVQLWSTAEELLPRTREDIPIITMEATLTMEGAHIPIVVLRMEMGMEEAVTKTVPTQQHPLRRI